MRNRDLIELLQGFDPEAVVELDVDVFPSVGASPGARQSRRVVDVQISADGKRVIIEGCGELRPREEELLDGGFYNQAYTQYESHWNGLMHDRTARRRILRDEARFAEVGLNYEAYVGHSWDELPLRLQQIVMVRWALPGRVHG